MFAKDLLEGFRAERKSYGKLVFVDEKLRVFSTRKWSEIYASPRRGFLVQIDKSGKSKPLNIYRDSRGEIAPRTLARWLKEDWEIQIEIKKRRREEKNVQAIQPNSLLRTRAVNLPKKILVLDIETSGKLDDSPSPGRILLVGIKEFNLTGSGYRPSAYEPYIGDMGWDSLRSRLAQSADLILGHNLFGFDYYFLETILQIEPIFGSTVDLFLWLYTCVGFHRGLGLDNLCRLNLGVWKMRFGKSVRELSAQPDKQHLYRYNERDLDLTFRLWLHAVEQKTIQTHGAGCLRATTGDLDYLSGRKLLVSYEDWMKMRKAENSMVLSPLHCHAVTRRLGQHDTEKVVWPSYSVIVCSACCRATVFRVSESFRRQLEEGADFPAQVLVKRALKSYRLRCECGQSIRARSSARPTLLGSAAIKPCRKRTDGYWSPTLHQGRRYLLSPFGETWEKLFRKFKLGRRTAFSTTFKRNPTPTEAAQLTAAIGEQLKNSLTFNEKNTVYLLIDRDAMRDLANGIDIILENYWKGDVSWISQKTVQIDHHCGTCGSPLTIHDIPLVHPIIQTPICQPCVRLGRHRYFHRGEWQPHLKKKFFDVLIPTIYSRDLTAYYGRSGR